MRARFNGDGLVNDVAFDTGRRGQANLEATNTTDNATIDHNIIGDNFTTDRRTFTDDQQMRADIAIDDTLDVDITRGAQIADDLKVR